MSLNLAGCNAAKIAAIAAPTTGAAIASNCTSNGFGAVSLFNNFSSASTNVTNNFPNYGGSDNGLWKLDYHLNDHHTVNGSYFIGNYNEYAVPNSQGFTQPYWEELLGVRSQLARVVEIWSPNSNWLNEARVGWDHDQRPVARGECTSNGDTSNPSGNGASSGGSVGGVAGPNYATQYGLVSGTVSCGIPTITISGFSGQLGFANNRVQFDSDYQGSDNISYTRGKHQFKFGVDVRAEHFSGAKVQDGQSGTAAFGSSGFAAFSGATALETFLEGKVASETIRAASNVRTISTNKIALFAQDDWRVLSRLTVNAGLRWEMETPVRDAMGLMGNFAPGTPTGMIQNNQVFKTQSDFSPHLGFSWDTTGKGTTVLRAGGGVAYMIPKLMDYIAGGNGEDYGGEPTGAVLFNANGTTIAPTGTIKSGLINPAAITSGGVITVPLTWAANTALFNPVAQCGNGLANGVGGFNPAPCNGQGGDPNLKLFQYISWNLNVQHAFAHSVSLDLGYVGSHSSDVLPQIFDLNQPAPGPAGGSNEQLRRPFYSAANNGYGVAYPWFSKINYAANLGSANYASLQANLTARNLHGLTLNANYTLSHALAQGAVTDARFPKLDYGNLSFDARHHFTMAGTYSIPGRKAPGQMLQGWAVNASMNIISALPLNLNDSRLDVAGTGGTARWTLFGPASALNSILGGAGTLPCYGIAGSSLVKASGSPCITVVSAAALPQGCITAATNEPNGPGGTTGLAQLSTVGCYYYNGSGIVAPAQGTFGNMTINELRGKGIGLLNMSATKDWKIKERLTTQFRFEVFNVLNRTQYGSVGTSLGTPSTLGLSANTPDVQHGNPVVGSGGPRAIQLALKLLF